jgi:hypothetical protein
MVKGAAVMSIELPQQQLDACKAAAAGIDADVFLYNSELVSHRDFEMVNVVAGNRTKANALLVLVTNGGDPDCAYRIARYFQENYESLTVLVAGRCKSAGTLIALGATEIAFMPYGELGPLDIQMTKVDKFDHTQSGLTIQDALNTLESRATKSFFDIVSGYMAANQGLLSFPSASKAASDFITQLYAPILGRIDPEEVGARSRAMKIAVDYGQRLSLKWQNVKAGTVEKLAETYSSHSFVIDMREAAELFHRVRPASNEERAIVEALGMFGRFPMPRDEKVLTALYDLPTQEQPDAHNENQGESLDGGDPAGAVGEAQPEAAPATTGKRRLRAVPAPD